MATGTAQAQISGGASSTAGGSCSGANNADGYCAQATSIPVNNGTTLQSRHAWNINADVGVASTRDTSSNGRHNVTFNVTAPGGYRIDIATQRTGDINRVNDLAGCSGSADTSGITGSSNIALNSGTLSLADPGGFGTGGSTTSTPFNQTSSAQIFRVSNGVAQGHSLTFTWSGSVRSNSCEAAVRQGQQNGSTTGCSACGYAGSPARTQATDGHFVTVTYTSLCGNGVVDAAVSEQCDQGGANGSATSCCTSSCQFRAGGQTCRTSAGECDVAETCTGSAAACPGDSKRPNGFACTADANPCSLDQCDGTNNACQHPAGNAGATCRSSAGICDVAETCTGASTTCPSDGFQSSATVCRASAGECDVAENCTGSAAACPGDSKRPNGFACTADANPCSLDQCDGTNNACQHPAGNAGATCRSSAGICDVAETCTGASTTCPSDGFQSSATVCRPGSGDLCDPDENCTGSAAACPSDVVASAGTLCNPGSGDLCDPDETCTGVASQACPSDNVAPNGTVCNPGSGDVCDPDEVCSGTADQACPADTVSPASTVCRAVAGVCDVAENCTGTADQACPGDSVSGAFVVCRASAGECDAVENCDGAGVNCPADAKQPLNTPCTSDGNVCSQDICDGVGDACTYPAGNAGAVCRSAAGVCDVVETCDGSSTACPPDGKTPSGTLCRASGGICDVAEDCDGVGDNCPPDGFQTGTTCRAIADVCDVAETCPGNSANCPADGFASSATVCRAVAGICDLAENCTGSAAACPADAFKPATTVCRAAVDACDIAEQCTGSGALCPSDSVQPDTDSDAFCDPIDNCPVVPNPGQEDTDGDTAGDACDLCTNTLPSFADRGKVILGKLTTPNTPTPDDTAKIKGRCIPFQETPTIDPVTSGMRLVMQDALGNLPLDVTIPGGAYDTVTKAGWKTHTFPTGMTAQYKNAGTVIPLINGIKKLKFVLKSGLGITKFSAVGKGGNYPVGPGGDPVKVTLIATPPLGAGGQCCEMTFPGPAPTPACTVLGGGATLRCK